MEVQAQRILGKSFSISYDIDLIGDTSLKICSIFVFVFTAAETCLLYRCLLTTRGYTDSMVNTYGSFYFFKMRKIA
jgi:hypothetical protein